MSAEIVVLPTGYDPERDQAVVTRDASAPCQHREVKIDSTRTRLICRRCDEEVAPIKWIEGLAANWQWYQTRVAMAQRRATDAERSAEERVKRAKRQRPSVPMPVGRRLAGIARQVGRAHGSLAEASASLAEVHETGGVGLARHHLEDAEAAIARARSSLHKLVVEHGRPAAPAKEQT